MGLQGGLVRYIFTELHDMLGFIGQIDQKILFLCLNLFDFIEVCLHKNDAKWLKVTLTWPSSSRGNPLTRKIHRGIADCSWHTYCE
jgi:hypothetical protein